MGRNRFFIIFGGFVIFVGLTKSTAMDYAKNNIICNAVCPAGTDTPLTEAAKEKIYAKIAELKAQGIDPSEFMKNSMIAGKTQTLQGRNATSEEQASSILYFASDEARHITGSIVAMTANAFAEDVQKALDAGMNAHVAKPIDMDVLQETLYKVLKR